MKKGAYLVGFLSSLFIISGCATTTPNNHADIDALNARVTALQGQLSSKDEELSRLESELRDKNNSLSQAESDKRSLEAELNAERSKPVAKPVPKYDSDLK